MPVAAAARQACNRVVALLLCVVAVMAAGTHPASATTGILSLDQAAIAVRVPDHVYLDAIVRAGDRLVAAGEHGVIIYSDDNGATWRQAHVPVDATLTAVAFATPREGWAVGNAGVVLHSDDYGVNWVEQLDGVQANQLTLAAARTMSPLTAQSPGGPNALRRAGIFMQQGPSRPFLSVLAIGPQNVLAFGAYRMTMRTADGGASWADWSLHIFDALSHHLYGAVAVGPRIYVVGEDGLVFQSRDGGATFAAVTSPTNATLFGVMDTGAGILVYGVAGQAFRSGDEGQSWQKVTLPSATNLMAAIALNAGAILLAGESGTLLVSRDGARSFQALPVAIPMAVYDMAQAANGDIVVAGNLGIIRIQAKNLNQN